jgi:hypothetical protein
VESASRKIPVSVYSPEGKRLLVRHLNFMQLSMHFISVIARISLPNDVIENIEADIITLMEEVAAKVDKAIAEAEKACQAHGITKLATYDIEPLSLEMRIISTFGRRYLELISKVDLLMPMLETLAIEEIISIKEVGIQKGEFKHQIKRVVGAARNYQAAIYKRMNAAARVTERKVETANPESALPDLDSATIANVKDTVQDIGQGHMEVLVGQQSTLPGPVVPQVP